MTVAIRLWGRQMVAVMDLSSEILRFITMSFGPHRMQWTTT